MTGGLPQPPGGFDPYGAQFQEDPQRQAQMSALPQPPLQQGAPPQVVPPSPQGQTLGAAQDLGSTNPLMQEFTQVYQGLQPMLQGAMRQPLPQEAAPSVLTNILTFGASYLQHKNRQSVYNQGVTDYNKQLQLWAAETAKDLVNENHKAQALTGEAGLKQFNTQLRLLEFQQRMQNAQNTEFNRQFNRNFKGTVGPASPADLESEDAQGLTREPSGIPNRYNLKPKAGGGWDLPGPGPAPGSPAAAALGGGTPGAGGAGAPAGGAVTGAPTPGPQPGESPTAYLQRRKAEGAGATEKAKNQTALGMTIDQLKGELEPMRTAARKVLPKLGGGGILGGTLKTHIGGPVSLLHAQYSKDPELRDAAKTLSSAGRNVFNLIKGEAGGTSGLRITNAEIQQFGKQFNNIASGRATMEDAVTYIDNLTDFLDRRDPRKTGATTLTPTSSTTSTTTPSGAGGTHMSWEDFLAR